MTTIVGLDVGSSAVRLVAARMAKGAWEVQAATTVPLDRLSQELRERKLSGCRCVVGVTGRDMILRLLQVPPVPAWQLADLMSLEVEDVSEQSGDDLSADYVLLEGAAHWLEEPLALLALLRTRLVEERAAELKASGLRVAGFTPNAVALANAVVSLDGAEGTVLVATLGGRNTDIALLHDGELLYARNLAGGGDLFTEALAETFKLDPAKAEAVKRQRASFPAPGAAVGGQQGAIARALAAPLRQVTGMLHSTLVLARNQLRAPDLKLDRVLIAGPGASVEGLDQALAAALNLPVERFDPLDGYLVGDDAVPPQRAGDYAVAAGLTLMALAPQAIRVEVLAPAARRARHFRERTAWLLAAGALLVAHLVLAAFVARDDSSRAGTDLARLRREVESRKADSASLARSLNEAHETAARLAAIEDLTAPGAGVLTVLEALQRRLPEDLWVTSIRTLRAVEADFGHGDTRRPYVIVEGSGKEQSRGLTEAVTALTRDLRLDPEIAAVKPRFSTDPRGRFNFQLTLDTSRVPPAEAALDDGPAEGRR